MMLIEISAIKNISAKMELIMAYRNAIIIKKSISCMQLCRLSCVFFMCCQLLKAIFREILLLFFFNDFVILKIYL